MTVWATERFPPIVTLPENVPLVPSKGPTNFVAVIIPVAFILVHSYPVLWTLLVPDLKLLAVNIPAVFIFTPSRFAPERFPSDL